MLAKTRFFLFHVLVIFFNSLNSYGQTVELDEVKQLPSISRRNMQAIALVANNLYKLAKLEPTKYSNIKAVSETVYAFYDVDWNGTLDKINPLNGRRFSEESRGDLDVNNRLLFNLDFDEQGKLIVPEFLYVISCREETQEDRKIVTVGSIAFKLPTEEYQDLLSKILLTNLAKTDINSLTGELNPVAVKIPFELAIYEREPRITNGEAIKRGDRIDISIERYFDGIKEKEEFIEMIKAETDIQEYKKGRFNFSIAKTETEFYFDMNIPRGLMVSMQAIKFSVYNEKVATFEGEGKR